MRAVMGQTYWCRVGPRRTLRQVRVVGWMRTRSGSKVWVAWPGRLALVPQHELIPLKKSDGRR
jgi:hypothetical protein